MSDEIPWGEAAQQAAATRSSGGDYLRLADGQAVEIVLGPPTKARQEVWTGTRSEDYDPVVHAGQRPRQVYDVRLKWRGSSKSPWEGAVFTASTKAFGAFADAAAETGVDAVYVLRRKGVGLETTYTVQYRRAISAADKAALSQCEFGSLEPREPVEAAGQWDEEDDEGGPF